MSTPHNSAKPGDIAEIVLMPGDPLRAKFIADNFLEGAVLYNELRGMLGFTGKYKGKRISVQGSGMGVPSMGIYSYELYNFYGVKSVIRVGTAGSLSPKLHVGDVVIAQTASYDTNYASQYRLPGVYAPCADYGLLEKAVEAARSANANVIVGGVLTSDAFYGEIKEDMELWSKMDVLVVEMETAALYMNAARAKTKALSILTVSDEIFTGVSTTAQERQTSFTKMMEIALNTATAM